MHREIDTSVITRLKEFKFQSQADEDIHLELAEVAAINAIDLDIQSLTLKHGVSAIKLKK